MLRDEQLLAWWRLSKLPGVGNMALNNIRSQLADPRELVRTSPDQLIAFGLSADAAAQWSSDATLSDGFESLKRWRQIKNCGVLMAGIAPYPEQLSALPDAPFMLYYHGNIDCLSKPMVAIVGSRNATPYALEWAEQVASDLAAAGLVVVSGLALGVDGAAHQGAVKTGSTIAVLGSGADVIYPQRHLGLAQMIMSKGLLLSEFVPGTPPKSEHFPSRNRVVSGLALGVIVVEAAAKSGSLITARFAAEQGREVFALPGSVTNPLSAGCHQLIRDGAVLVRHAQDVLSELGLEPGAQADLLADAQADNLPELLRFIDFTTTSTDVIGIRAGLPIAELLPQLLDLELQGWLKMVPGGYVRAK